MDTGSVEFLLKRLLEEGQGFLTYGRYAEAEALSRHAISQGLGVWQLWHMLSLALRGQGRLDEAVAIQEQLVQSQPGNYACRYSFAVTLLLAGDFERGWREYRFRDKQPHTQHLERKVQRPRWEGEPLGGRTLLIHDEQGFGDSFQFIRLVPRVKALGARIVLQVRSELVGLAERMAGHDYLVPQGALPPPFDLHIELMSLPAALNLMPADLPGPIPYLSADPSRLSKWRLRLAGLPRPLVALAWAGRPTHVHDKVRSIALAQMAALAKVAGMTFLSIQKGPQVAEARTPPAGMALLDLDAEIADFEDTAAILSLVDLLISVDSAPIHLAGALGRPAWVLLPFVPEWRWMLGRDDTPWYPSVQLFRQAENGNWNELLERVARALISSRAGSA